MWFGNITYPGLSGFCFLSFTSMGIQKRCVTRKNTAPFFSLAAAAFSFGKRVCTNTLQKREAPHALGAASVGGLLSARPKRGSSGSPRAGTWPQDPRGTLRNLQNARNPQVGLTGCNGLRLLCGGPRFRVLFASLLLLAGSPALILITSIYGNQVLRGNSSVSLDYVWPS